MRALVFLLIFANLLFFSWAQGYLGTATNPDALRIERQVLADNLSVVSRDTPPTANLAADRAARPPEKMAEERCVQWGDFSEATLLRMESLLKEKFPAVRATRIEKKSGATYWVYIPPLPTRRDAEKKAAELKALRVPEYYIVQESGPHNRAISLGLFSSREAAEERLASLRPMGVRSARVGEKSPARILTALALHAPATPLAELAALVEKTLPEARSSECKTTPDAPS